MGTQVRRVTVTLDDAAFGRAIDLAQSRIAPEASDEAVRLALLRALGEVATATYLGVPALDDQTIVRGRTKLGAGLVLSDRDDTRARVVLTYATIPSNQVIVAGWALVGKFRSETYRSRAGQYDVPAGELYDVSVLKSIVANDAAKLPIEF